MNTFINDRFDGGHAQPCAGGCGTLRRGQPGSPPYWCESCIEREVADAGSTLGILPATKPGRPMESMAPVLEFAATPKPATPVIPLPRQAVAARRSDMPVAEADLDEDLANTVRRTSYMRQGFYVVVLLVALAGQVSGAVDRLGIPLVAAIPAVGALELGGVVVLANADVRRRLGEKALASRLLSAAIAAGAVAFNLLAHSDRLLGAFFAGMSALGYLVWLMHTENQRRDRLRAKGDLPPTTPAYELVGHWLRHPLVTRRARSLAKVSPGLGLYGSIAAAEMQIRRERRQKAIAKVLHRKIRAAVDPVTADIAVAVYDTDVIAARLADGADYAGLTALVAADLVPSRIAAGPQSRSRKAAKGSTSAPGLSTADRDGPAISGRDKPAALPARASRTRTSTVAYSASSRRAAAKPSQRDGENRPERDGGDLRSRMREYAAARLAAGEPVTGADLDREFNTTDYGRKILRELRPETGEQR